MFNPRYTSFNFAFEFAIQRALFVVFLIKFERVPDFVETYRSGQIFGLRKCHPSSEFCFDRFLLRYDQMVGYFCGQLSGDVDGEVFGSTKMALFRLDSLVLGSPPKWDSNGVFVVSGGILNLRT